MPATRDFLWGMIWGSLIAVISIAISLSIVDWPTTIRNLCS